MNPRYPQHTGIRAFAAALGSIALLVLLLSVVSLPAHALPPRPEDVPVAEPSRTRGGGIALSVTGATVPYHAVVQWQDGLGGWHDVDGWRGEVEEDYVLWHVSSDHFGDGPFRWVVYNGEGTLGASETFTLPVSNGHKVRVFVALEQ